MTATARTPVVEQPRPINQSSLRYATPSLANSFRLCAATRDNPSRVAKNKDCAIAKFTWKMQDGEGRGGHGSLRGVVAGGR